MTRRDILSRRAAETVEALALGLYVDGAGEVVDISEPLARAKAGASLHDLGDLARAAESCGDRRETAVTVANETTLAGCRALGADDGERVCCLVFASAKNPGGGFLNGAEAQEESIARSSGLSACLAEQPEYYARNRALRSALYTDLAIYAPDVPVIRNDAEQLIARPWTASMIVAPTPNIGAIRKNEPARLREVQGVFARRIAGVLALARQQEQRRLVLGAWGCGVFDNDPAEVARLFAEALAAPEVLGAFDAIRFSVLDKPGGPRISAFEAQFA